MTFRRTVRIVPVRDLVVAGNEIGRRKRNRYETFSRVRGHRLSYGTTENRGNQSADGRSFDCGIGSTTITVDLQSYEEPDMNPLWTLCRSVTLTVSPSTLHQFRPMDESMAVSPLSVGGDNRSGPEDVGDMVIIGNGDTAGVDTLRSFWYFGGIILLNADFLPDSGELLIKHLCKTEYHHTCVHSVHLEHCTICAQAQGRDGCVCFSYLFRPRRFSSPVTNRHLRRFSLKHKNITLNGKCTIHFKGHKL